MKIFVSGNYFVSTNKELVESLFNNRGTACGLFKVRKNGVLFSDGKGDPFAFLVANKHCERFFVSCSRQPDGRIRYAYGLGDLDAKRLGILGIGHNAERQLAEQVWLVVNNKETQ